MSGTAYAVIVWDYEDLEKLAVFTTTEKRDAYLTECLKADSSAWGLDVELDPDPPEISHATTVWIHKDGKIGRTQLWSFLPWSWSWARMGFLHYGDDGDWMAYAVPTGDQDEAIKVVKEKQSQILAADAWGDFTKTRQVLGEQ
jgi:hypothetical protein